jgi:hypothetical protein
MCSISDECDATLGAYPSRKRVAEDKLPVYECMLGGCADDGMADWCPIRDRSDGFVDVAWCRPALFYVGVVLDMFSNCGNLKKYVTYLVCQDPAASSSLLQRRNQKVDIRPQPSNVLILGRICQERRKWVIFERFSVHPGSIHCIS